ncbi:DMT family transporter [Endozoicomonas atrinae]|uniref:DMT family transporter n=1 Tax=Endozoicomonas atrinae TaxID=1333660 RepID=UPI001EE72960|nr:DMT family transporter [Endozoicomonas atrinae]
MVLIAGSLLPLQAGVNALLANSSGHTIWAAGMSFFVGTFALLALFIILRTPWPMISQLRAAPAMAWTGGLMGAFFVSCMAFFAPKLGATTLLALVITGQIGMSLILDHFGVAGYTQHLISWQRLLGFLLMLSGFFFIRKF